MKNYNQNIILGTAQFSGDYGLGIFNSNKDKTNLLNKIIKYNCYGIDTALNYKNSQKHIGKWLLNNKNNIKIFTKIKGSKNIKEMKNSFEKCLNELQRDKIEGLMFHNQESINLKETRYLSKYLFEEKKINKIGLSLYDKLAIPNNIDINFIQIPGSIFNQEILKSKKLHYYIKIGGEVHVRSIFIQGLLLMKNENIPKKFYKLKEPLKKFHKLCNENKCHPITLATKSIEEFIPKFKLVLGVDNSRQFDHIIRNINQNIDAKIVKKAIALGEKYKNKLWDPRYW
tara:strand:- start:13290 stop:14144 length:855 start_codon:yes stop_codon:yes gene_type:complete